MFLRRHRTDFTLACILLAAGLFAVTATAADAIFTTTKDGTTVNANTYGSSTDVYISGGPQNQASSGLADGIYYFQVTDPSGNVLLSTDIALCRQLQVVGGKIAGSVGPPCRHANGVLNSANGTLPVQMFPFAASPNKGSEFKVWLITKSDASISPANPAAILFSNASARTDNFKVQNPITPPPPGSCQASSSLTVLVSGANVVGYVPKGNWSATPVTGVSVVNVEGSSVTPARVATPNVVNACAPNPLTGQVVCTANNTDVYLLSGTNLTASMTSSGSGRIFFSGGTCTNCGVSIDALHNKALIGMSVGGKGGFQFLNLAPAPSFETQFLSMAPILFPGFSNISEDSLIDPIRNLLLSPSEVGNYEIVDISQTNSPVFYENRSIGGELDSAGEECVTGIALAPKEFLGPSTVYIADLTQATFTPGSPGSWTAPSQSQILTESFLAAGASGVAVAQGTHTGVVTGEFGGNRFTAIALPASSGSGTPAIQDWVTCAINGYSNGFDPHTVTAYQSPSSGDAVAVLANGGATQLAVIDLTSVLDQTLLPRTPGGHACADGALPASMVRFIGVP